MKTALKDLIEKLQKFRLIKEDENSYELFRQLELESLEKEKEQIMNDYRHGHIDGFTSANHLGTEFENEDDYYNQTYNQNKSLNYCQREIEGQSICDKQCEHCKEYYAPLDNQNK